MSENIYKKIVNNIFTVPELLLDFFQRHNMREQRVSYVRRTLFAHAHREVCAVMALNTNY